jgi:hypothetical protein
MCSTRHLAEARFSFAQKALLARSLCLRKNKFGEWDLIAAINSLRNDLAHKLNSPDRAKKLAVVKELYFREAAGYDRIDDMKNESDAVILFNACAHCAGFLATFEADSKAFRRMVRPDRADLTSRRLSLTADAQSPLTGPPWRRRAVPCAPVNFVR